MALGGLPSEFWRQTPRSFVICMEGMARAAEKSVDRCIITAWHTARFALNGWGDKGRLAGGKSLSDLLSNHGEREQDPAFQSARAIHFFQSLQSAGFPIEISRTKH